MIFIINIHTFIVQKEKNEKINKLAIKVSINNNTVMIPYIARDDDLPMTFLTCVNFGNGGNMYNGFTKGNSTMFISGFSGAMSGAGKAMKGAMSGAGKAVKDSTSSLF